MSTTTATKKVTATIKGMDGRTAEFQVKSGEWGQQRYTNSCVLLDSPTDQRVCIKTNHWINGVGFLDVFIEGQDKPVWIYVGPKGSHRIYILVNEQGEIVGLGA